MKLSIFVVVLAVAACDPGWDYRARSAPAPEASSAMPVHLGRVSLFAGSLSAEFTVTNRTTIGTTVDSAWFTLRDAAGQTLPAIGVLVCGKRGGASLPPDSTCSGLASWSVVPFGRFWHRNERLRTLQLTISRQVAGAVVVDTFPLAWNS